MFQGLMGLMISMFVSAHGEDKPGPNGGFVRMPGAFHTEVVLDGKSALKLFLLDMEWKNPVVVDSTAEVTWKAGTTIKGKCQPKTDHFVCNFPQGTDLTKKGFLSILARRGPQKGNEAVYTTPLSWPAQPGAPPAGHHHHGH